MRKLNLLLVILIVNMFAFAGETAFWEKVMGINREVTTIYNYGYAYETQRAKKEHRHPAVVSVRGFKETVYISSPYRLLIKNIDLLYEMGYLPFYATIDKKEMGNYKVTFIWNTEKVPSKLANLVPTTPHSILYKSAVLRFDRDYDTDASPSDLIATEFMLKLAQESGYRAKKPFVWVYVDQHVPQKVYVWENGKYIFTSPANTGVMHTTATGNFMIYARYRSVEMRGYFPGTHEYYDDPAVPWVNFFYKGEAIHGYPRASYGYPQSAGCVELPISKAKELYPLLYTYAVVTVSRE